MIIINDKAAKEAYRVYIRTTQSFLDLLPSMFGLEYAHNDCFYEESLLGNELILSFKIRSETDTFQPKAKVYKKDITLDNKMLVDIELSFVFKQDQNHGDHYVMIEYKLNDINGDRLAKDGVVTYLEAPLTTDSIKTSVRSTITDFFEILEQDLGRLNI